MLRDRLDMIEDACAHVRATSALGAWFQMVLISADLDANEGWIAARARPN